MNGRAFSGLNILKVVWLHQNICIDEDFLDQTRVAIMAQVVDTKCSFTEAPLITTFPPTTTTTTLRPTTTTYVPTFRFTKPRTTRTSSIQTSFSTPATSTNQNCGKTSFLSGLVVGGTQTYRGQWPFLVALHHLETDKFFCGGSLISAQHVLTAAHCIRYKSQVKPLQADEFVALLGRFNLQFRYEQGSTTREISEVHIHPDWRVNSEKWDADLAIVVLVAPVKFTNYIQPVCSINIVRDKNLQDDGIVVSFGKLLNCARK